MKVILVDNYARESVADSLLIDALSEEEAKAVAEEYNSSNIGYWYAKVVPDDHRLNRGMEDLV